MKTGPQRGPYSFVIEIPQRDVRIDGTLKLEEQGEAPSTSTN